MPFNQFVSWIAYLQDSYGIEVVFLDIDKGDQDGLIEVNRLQLSRG
jgi:general secretion pathway protein M